MLSISTENSAWLLHLSKSLNYFQCGVIGAEKAAMFKAVQITNVANHNLLNISAGMQLIRSNANRKRIHCVCCRPLLHPLDST